MPPDSVLPPPAVTVNSFTCGKQDLPPFTAETQLCRDNQA